jgi:hypothetical protein
MTKLHLPNLPTAKPSRSKNVPNIICRHPGFRGFMSAVVNKAVLLQMIMEHLSGELATYGRAARAAHAEATHEQSRAENKYDTRGLEASYLARGQSRQAAALENTVQQYQALTLRKFAATDPIDLTALVVLKGRGGSSTYFIGPGAGGTEISLEGVEVTVITPQSPLGRQILGRRTGERLQLDLGGSRSEFRVVSIA